MWVIGELINCTRKKVGAAAAARDTAMIQETARKQVDAGADMLDVNGGLPGQEVETLAWLVEIVQEVADIPLCLDSADPEALRKALPLCKQRPMLNSISDEPEKWDALLPVVKEYRPKVMALCMSPAGPPMSAEARIDTASRLADRLTAEGMALDDIYVDACVLPASTGPEHSKALVDAIGQIMGRYPGIHTSAGVSNVSFGLPQRKLLNQNFITLLMAHGLDAAIIDPCDRQMMMNIRASEALLARDEMCMNYLRAFREGKLEPAAV